MRSRLLLLYTCLGFALGFLIPQSSAGPCRIAKSKWCVACPKGDAADETVQQERRRWEELCDELLSLARRHQGKVSFAVKHFDSGYECTFQENTPRPTASLIKLPIMVEAYRQVDEKKLDLDRMLEITDEDFVPGSGVLTQLFSSGTMVSLRDAIHLMIAKSDNTATNLVLNQIGIESTAETMAKWGWKETKVHSLTYKRETSRFPERSKQFGLGSTTAAEMLQLLERLHNGELVSAEATQAIRQHLLACDDRTKLAAGLPASAKFAHKTGAISSVRCDAGLLETERGIVALVVLTSENEDQSWDETNKAQVLCANLARRVYDFFSEKDSRKFQRALSVGATGALVQDLQRTLNAKLRPSPELAVDGDFGPATESAVRAWQEQSGLEINGVVGGATWNSLGALVTQDEDVPSPSEVNSEILPRAPKDSVNGRPFVTCKSWLIVDVNSGEVLDGYQEDERRDIASITKLMTALVVLRIAESEPSILEEDVEFSERADKTIGSTAGVRAGERVKLHDLLYGLLLPSGNDASIAIAESVGQYLLRHDQKDELQQESSGASPESDAYSRFVRAMNETAEELGLVETRFQNPHGLTASNHHSSATDVARLAGAVLRYELLRTIVDCRRYGIELRSNAGFRRNVVWKNTNKLLRHEGYSGIKTGTTSAAGACLVALGNREGKQLLVVILGATSSDARYVDARNLFRWGWQQTLDPHSSDRE